MGLFSRSELSDANILSIVLAGMFEADEKVVYCNGLERQLEKTLCEVRDHPLISSHFHFATAGAYPWSHDFRNAYWVLQTSSSYMGWLTPGPDYVESGMKKLAELLRRETKVPETDYNFLMGLGKKIEVMGREN